VRRTSGSVSGSDTIGVCGGVFLCGRCGVLLSETPINDIVEDCSFLLTTTMASHDEQQHLQFQIPNFVLGGTPNVAHGGGAEVLPGMYGQGPQVWSEYDKYWCSHCLF
jgi:hypothetical protein